MGVGHLRLLSSIETIKRFSPRDVFMGQGIDIFRLETRPAVLHFHSVAVCLRCAVELQDPLLKIWLLAINYQPRPRMGNNLRNRCATFSAILPQFYSKWARRGEGSRPLKCTTQLAWVFLASFFTTFYLIHGSLLRSCSRITWGRVSLLKDNKRFEQV